MARGWESKDVESQKDTAEERQARKRAVQVSENQVAHERELESVQLSRTRVLADMEAALNPRYREILQRSLDHLDSKLAALQTRPKETGVAK